MQDAGLYVLTEAMQKEIVHRENVLKESEQIIAEQYRIDWNTVKEELKLQRRDEVRMGGEI